MAYNRDKPRVYEVRHLSAGEVEQFGKIAVVTDSPTLAVGIYGGFALIDADDLHILESRRWNLAKSKNTHYVKYKRRAEQYYLHRVILGVTGQHQIDHINRIGWDNRKINLRISDFLW